MPDEPNEITTDEMRAAWADLMDSSTVQERPPGFLSVVELAEVLGIAPASVRSKLALLRKKNLPLPDVVQFVEHGKRINLYRLPQGGKK